MRNAIKKLILAVAAISFLIGSSPVLSLDTVLFRIMGSTSAAKVGESFDLTVVGTVINDLYAYEVVLTYDDRLLELKDIVSDIEGYTVQPPAGRNQIRFALAKMKNQMPERGEVSLCTLTFTAKRPGSAVVNLESIKLLDEILSSETYYLEEKAEILITGDGGGPAPTTVPALVATPLPNPSPAPDESAVVQEISVVAQPGTDGTEVAVVGIDDFMAAVRSGEKDIIVKVQSSPEANGIMVELPAAAAAGLEEGRTVKISTDMASVSLASDFLKNVVKEDSEHLQLSVSIADKAALSEEVKEIVGSNTVYDFNLSVDGKTVSSFEGKNSIEVEISYTLKPDEDPENVIIYFIDDEGGLHIVKNGVYNPDTGKVRFRPVHFSKYAAVHKPVAFSDTGNVPWARESINALAARGIINGVGGSLFNPNSNVTRAEFVKMLMEAFDLVNEAADSDLKDVRKDAWYYKSVASAQLLGIVKGRSDGNFGVDDRASREEIAVMAYRMAKLINADLDGPEKEEFSDRADISDYAVEAVEAMQRAGILNGVGGGRFAPAKGATRAEAAVIVYRLFRLYLD